MVEVLLMVFTTSVAICGILVTMITWLVLTGMLYCVIIHLLNKYGRHLVIFCGLLLNSMFHHVLALETEKMIMFNQGQKSHTNCGNVLRENANYEINYISHPMILICVVNTEKVYIFGESYYALMRLCMNNALLRQTTLVLFTVLSIHAFLIVLLLVP